MHELPLVLFTVLTQVGVGAFIILYLGHKLSTISDRQLAVGLFCSVIIFGLGVVLASFHLGQPLRALNVFHGIGRSPMSNEVLLSALFGACAGLSALGLLLDKGGKGLFNLLAGVAVLLGAGFIIVVPMVYRIETVPTWANSYTTLVMILTPFIGGGVLAATFGAIRLGSALSALGIIVALAVRTGYINALSFANASLATAQESWFTAQSAILAIVLVFCVAGLFNRLTSKGLFALCTCMAIIAELLGRIAFYNLWVIPM